MGTLKVIAITLPALVIEHEKALDYKEAGSELKITFMCAIRIRIRIDWIGHKRIDNESWMTGTFSNII